MSKSDFESRGSKPVAVVTGGAAGIGNGIVHALFERNFDVIVADISVGSREAQNGDYGGAPLRSLYLDVGDVSQHESFFEKAFQWRGRLDCLVNNAGIPSPSRGDILEVTPSSFDKVLEVNLRGTFFLSQAFVKHVVRNRNSVQKSIINVSSVSAEMVSIDRSEYCISKASLPMITKLFATRFASEDISVFEVRPGIIKTGMTEPVVKKYERRFEEGLVPMGGWGMPEDIGNAVAELATGKFAFATGSTLNVDGGLSISRL